MILIKALGGFVLWSFNIWIVLLLFSIAPGQKRDIDYGYTVDFLRALFAIAFVIAVNTIVYKLSKARQPDTKDKLIKIRNKLIKIRNKLYEK